MDLIFFLSLKKLSNHVLLDIDQKYRAMFLQWQAYHLPGIRLSEIFRGSLLNFSLI